MNRFPKLYRQILARVPQRPRVAFRVLWEGLLNRLPDGPFMSSRHRYGRRLQRHALVEPPLLLRMAAYRRHVPSDVQAFQLLGRPELSMVNVDSLTTRVIFWTGADWIARHAAGLRIWAQLCGRANVVVELGANVGYYTIAGGATAYGSYTAYEPHPRSCAALRRNIELNGVTRVRVIESAAVPEPGLTTVELICPTGSDRDTPSGAMVKGSPFEKDDLDRPTETCVVSAVPFGDVIEGSDLLKIDVEGLEAQLLTGAWAQVAATKPALMLEVHQHNRDLRLLVPRLIAELGATAFAMRSDHLVPVSPDVLEHGPLSDTCQTYDFLIVPTERAELVEGLVRSNHTVRGGC